MLEYAGGYLGEFTFGGNDEVKPVRVPVRLDKVKDLLETPFSAGT